MTGIEIIFYFATILLGVIGVWLKWTAANGALELFLNVVMKGTGIFVILYAGFNLLKHFGAF